MSNFITRIISSLIIMPIFLYMIYIKELLFIFVVIFLFIATFEIFFLIKKKNYISFIFLFILIILFLFSLVKLRGISNLDYLKLLWIFLIVWLSDIGGYTIGKMLKGPKLSKLSPSKTVSGFFGSIIISQFSFLIISQFFEDNLIYNYKIFIIQLVISFISIVGDLFFSYIKRLNSIKDYSQIIPGHGGLLDRMDGLIFAIIFSNYFNLLNVF